MISIAVASGDNLLDKSPPLTTQSVVQASDIFVMPVCYQTPFVMATVDLSTQTVLPAQKGLNYFMQNGKSIAGPITIMEGLVAKKDLSVYSFNLINPNNARNQFTTDVLTLGSTSYSVLKHPLIISEIINTGSGFGENYFNQSINANIT